MLPCYCVFKLLKIKAVRLGEKVIVQESGIGSKGSKVMESKVMGGWGLGSKVKAQIWKVAQSKVKRIEDQRIRGRVPG